MESWWIGRMLMLAVLSSVYQSPGAMGLLSKISKVMQIALCSGVRWGKSNVYLNGLVLASTVPGR